MPLSKSTSQKMMGSNIKEMMHLRRVEALQKVSLL
jgi:hypothetical protein